MGKLKRRDFIKNSLLAGVSGSLAVTDILRAGESTLMSDTSDQRPQNHRKVIVAGAGISGLCCAYELMKRGHEVVVLEASGRHGGHVFTGRDGLSDGLYTDYGADHVTQPGYEVFFDYVKEFNLTALPYLHAEGSDAAPGRHALRMIDGKFYSEDQLADRTVLKQFGFNEREVKFLSTHKWHDFRAMFVEGYLGKFKDPLQPYGVGYDDLDNVSIADIFKKEGASQTALRFLGGKNTSALYVLWRMSVMQSRGIPWSEGQTFHLKGGNQEMTNAFAKKLGTRVLLNHAIQSIQHSDTGVTVRYKAFGFDEENEMTADYLVNCITLPVFRNIPVTPVFSPGKQYVIDHLKYSSHPFFVFEASSKFWLDDGLKSINMEFEHPDISSIWQETNDVDSPRFILKAYGPGGISPQRVLAAFRSLYPGKRDTIVQALTLDWTKDRFAPACEMEPFDVGEMSKFWPEVMKPAGRIYFAGTYADTMSRGMESCLRSALRVADEINKA